MRVDRQASLDLTGGALVYLAVPLSVPPGVAVVCREPLAPFLVAVAVTVLLGGALRELPGRPGDLDPGRRSSPSR